MIRRFAAALSLTSLPPPARRLVPPLLAVAGVAVALATQFTIAYGDAPHPGFGFVAGALLLGAGVLLDSRKRNDAHEPESGFDLPFGAEVALFAFVVGLAVFFRFYKFYSFPPGLWYDEAVNASDAISLIDHDHVRLWFDTVFGRSTLYLYLLAGSFKVFGYTIFAIRIVPTVAGLSAVVAFYFLARHVAGTVPALIASALHAVSRWAVTFSRISWEASIQPVIEILAVYWFMRAMETRKAWQFALSGFFLALGLYSYVAFRMVPAVVAVFGLLWLATRWRELRAQLPGLATFIVVFVIAVAPLGIFTVMHPDKVSERARQVSVFKEVDKEGSYDPLWHNFRATWRMFNVQGDQNGRHNLPFAPELDDLSAALFVLGIAVSLWSFRDWRRAGVAPWLVLALVPGALTLQVENPSAIRGIGAVPAVFLLEALAVGAVYRVLAVSRIGLAVFAAGAIALVGGSTLMNYDEIFNHQAAALSVYDSFTPIFTQTAKVVAGHADSERVYISRLFSHQALTTLAHDKQYAPYSTSANVIFPRGDKDVLVVMDSQQLGVLPTLRRLYPHLSVRDYRDPFGKVYWSEVRIPAADTNVVHAVQMTVHEGASPDGAILQAPQDAAVNRDWSAADLGTSGTVTATWEAYTWIGSARDLGALEFSAPGSVAIEIDGKAAAAGRGHATADLKSLPFGEHQVRLTATISQPGATAFTVGDGRPGDDALYTTSVGQQGFEAVYHPGRDFATPPSMIARYPFAVAADPLPGAQAIEYRATFSVPDDGDYDFALGGSAAAQLFVDDQLLADNGGAHGAKRTEGTITLNAGVHNFMIQYVVVTVPDWSAFMRLPGQDWKLLDGSEFSVPAQPYTPASLVTIQPDPSWAGDAATGAAPDPSAVTLLADGTIVVASKASLVFVSPTGAVQRTTALPDGVSINDLATDAAGEIVAGDGAGRALLIIGADGTVLRTIEGPFMSVTGVAARGGDAFVASAAGGVLYRVPVSGGTPERLEISKDSSPVRAVQPSDIAVTADGTYLVTDFERKKIVISPDGVHATAVSGLGGVGGQVPRIAIYGSVILVSDPTNDRIVAYDQRGRQRGAYAFPASTFGTRPMGMAVTPEGVLYVVTMNRGVLRFRVTVPPELAAELAQP